MSKIKELLNQFCKNGISHSELKEICISLKKGTLKTTELIKSGYPVINSGRSLYGYYSEYNNEGNAFTVAARGEYAGYLNYFSDEFWAGGLCYPYRSKDEKYVRTKYVYYYLKNIEKNIKNELVSTGGIPALNKADLEKIMIPIPAIEVQDEIINILDKFSKLEAELEAELEARKNQYEFWRGKIIDDSEGKYGKLIELLSGPVTDGPHTTPKLVPEGVPFISATAVHEGKIHLKDAQGFITKEFDTECSKKYKPQKWDVYMVKSGSTTGKVAIVDIDDDFNIWSPLAAMRTENEITSRYLYHLLQTKNVQDQVQSRMSHGSQPNLSMRVLEQFDVKIPTLEEQKRIVNILDKFDALINDITIGLPAEIELRKQQYEYYRNYLLNFEEVINNE